LITFLNFFRHRPVVAVCLALSIVLAAANVFLSRERHVAEREHDEIVKKGQLTLRALANRNRIDTDLAALQVALAQIDKNLLDEQSMEVNLGYFYKLEKPAHVRLARLNQLVPVTPITNGPFKAVPFSMQVVGSYRNALGFLRALETGSRIAHVRNCTFERSPTENGDLMLDLTVDVLAKL
jgi:Tfp pilus assembly protein PilO